MPSIHVAWAAVVSIGVFAVTTSRWRWVLVGHVPVTILVVAATGHHWWLDGGVAIALMGVALWIDRWGRQRGPRRLSMLASLGDARMLVTDAERAAVPSGEPQHPQAELARRIRQGAME